MIYPDLRVKRLQQTYFLLTKTENSQRGWQKKQSVYT